MFSIAPAGNDIAQNNMPAEYRECIKANGEELFKALEQYGH